VKSPVLDGVVVKSSTGELLGVPYNSLSFTHTERELLCQSDGCPINKKIFTKMSRASFVRMCKAYKERSDKKTSKGINIHGLLICQHCLIGKNIEKGKKYNPPNNIEFIDLNNDGKIRKITKSKLDERKVLLIRKAHNDGKTLTAIALKYRLSIKVIDDIINRETWKHI